MKKYIGFMLIALAAATSCTKEQNNPEAKKILTFTADTDETKTSLSTGFSIIWSSEDHISVFAGDNASATTFDATEFSNGGHTATFQGTAEESSVYYALSPAQTGASILDGIISAVLPSSQNLTVGSFDPAAALSVSTANDYVFNFKNVGALVGFTAGQDGLTGIKLEAVGGEVLSGTAVVNPADGTLVSKSGDSYVEMNGSFVNGSTYYLVVLPGTYAQGFRITLYKGAEYTRLTKSGSLSVERNGNLALGSLSGNKWKTSVGENVKIKGSAEDGQDLVYVAADGYWNTGITGNDVTGYAYNYEIFTRLNATDAFYFEAARGEKFALNAAGNEVERIAKVANAAYRAPEDGVYRIRLALPEGIAEVKQINEVKYDLYGLDSVIAAYQREGVWAFTSIQMHKGEYYQNRYRFLVKFTDGTKQYYGRWKAEGGNPTYGTTAADYFYIQPSTDADHWDPCFKFQLDYEVTGDRYRCKMTLDFSNANGHYNHSITDIWDKQHPIATGEDLTVQGAAIASPDAAGAKMRYSTSFYNSDVANSGDRVDKSSTMADPAGYDYEIFVKLSANTKFYFSTASGHHFAINSTGDAIEGIINEGDIAFAGVGNEGVYRIRINSTKGKVALRRAESARYLQPDRGTNQELSYLGNGVWRGYPAFGWTHPNAGDNSKRFKFKFQIYFNETSTWQYYGRYETESTYTSTHIQPITDTSSTETWNNFLTVEGDPELGKAEYQENYGYCDMYLKLNADGYTYEINSIRK